MFGDKTQAIADKLFEQYYKHHRIFYSNIQNYVLHLHRHFGTQYRNYGSLANIGCFHQEDQIGHIKKPLDKCFILLSKEPSDLFDVININHVIKHCITFEFQQQLIVSEVSAYHEHD
ncbi:unnamed protein product [Rotaria sp. Silwood1]|nr:unnamed protein product [Rotaria sp. Silwood1]